MTLTTHTVIGAAIGSLIGNPLAGFILGMLSHFLVDMIPHGDIELYDLFRKRKKRALPVAYVSIDYTIALVFALFLFPGGATAEVRSAFAWGVAGSVLPDILVGLSDIFKHQTLHAFRKFHFFFHDLFSRRYGDVRLRYALAGQLMFIFVVVHFVLQQ